ncbi:transposable element Tcb2 transposase [Trichonephila clavipes]|nr:transposable element Tcb2 transposase [Trichonephila clavipes]
MPLRRFRKQYEQLSQFERGRIIGMIEAGWLARPGSGRSRQTSNREDRHIVRNARLQTTASPAAIQSQVESSSGTPVSSRIKRRRLAEGHLGSDESRFSLSSDDNRVLVWRPRGERLNPAFALQRHTAPTAGVRVWGAIEYNSRSP